MPGAFKVLRNMNYFHLDIKPANIIVQTTPTDGKSHIRFIDFDGSRPKDDKNLDYPIRIQTITPYYAPNGNLLRQDYAFPKLYDEHCMLKTIEEILGKVSVSDEWKRQYQGCLQMISNSTQTRFGKKILTLGEHLPLRSLLVFLLVKFSLILLIN